MSVGRIIGNPEPGPGFVRREADANEWVRVNALMPGNRAIASRDRDRSDGLG